MSQLRVQHRAQRRSLRAFHRPGGAVNGELDVDRIAGGQTGRFADRCAHAHEVLGRHDRHRRAEDLTVELAGDRGPLAGAESLDHRGRNEDPGVVAVRSEEAIKGGGTAPGCPGERSEVIVRILSGDDQDRIRGRAQEDRQDRLVEVGMV
jgi:hypothetical protein